MVIHEGVIVPPDCFGVNGLTSVVQLPLNIITSMCMILVHAKKRRYTKVRILKSGPIIVLD